MTVFRKKVYLCETKFNYLNLKNMATKTYAQTISDTTVMVRSIRDIQPWFYIKNNHNKQ
jgi:hypothetical protein